MSPIEKKTHWSDRLFLGNLLEQKYHTHLNDSKYKLSYSPKLP